ncbi:MAG: nucleotide exchange factor GrpE [Deltaproteobacteria bacterium]|nr:nucleotide exchange factor GrpE [Deltaproteobacteria bacterium]
MTDGKEEQAAGTRDSGEKNDLERANSEQENRQAREDEEKPLDTLTKQELVERVERIAEEYKKSYDQYLRSQADMDNVKKRLAKEKEEWVRFSNESLIKQLLPVMDNLEKAIAHSGNDRSPDALREGVELTLKGLKSALEKFGLSEVQAQGEPFDPCFHEAVSEMEGQGVKPKTVLHELQKGYMLNDRLIRPAMVVVSKAEDSESSGHNGPPEESCEQ